MEIIKNKVFSCERDLYGIRDTLVLECDFSGSEISESPLKECRNIEVENSSFELRYPLWHALGLKLKDSHFKESCRAPLWYSSNIEIDGCELLGVKALRECKNVKISNSLLVSDELGWFSSSVDFKNTELASSYFMLRGKDLSFNGIKMTGKYSFQYIENARVENSMLETKDAFWHAKNVYVKNCYIKGEYLGWYSEGLTLENCVIYGTQPFCYCKNLKLINCEMHECDLAFERSEVEATITTPVVSIKNVYSGNIYVPSVEKIICDSEDFIGKIHTSAPVFEEK